MRETVAHAYRHSKVGRTKNDSECERVRGHEMRGCMSLDMTVGAREAALNSNDDEIEAPPLPRHRSGSLT